MSKKKNLMGEIQFIQIGNKSHERWSDYTKRREKFQQIAEQEYGKGVPALILQ